ncbi:DUF4405 domain-containing protein [Chloroflexota bacterium]
MNYIKQNYIYYFTVFLAFSASLGVIASSIIIWFVLPRGIGQHNNIGRTSPNEPDCTEYCNLRGEGTDPIYGGNIGEIFEWPRYLWVEYHAWISVILASIVLIHIIIHWKWIIEITKRIIKHIRERRKNITERYITVSTLFILFTFQVFSGCVIWLILPRGADDYVEMIAGIGRTFWWLQRDVWSDLHAWVAAINLALVVLHIALHWRWIVSMTLGKKQVEVKRNN